MTLLVALLILALVLPMPADQEDADTLPFVW